MLKQEYRRGPSDPLPTVAQVEDALDTLLTAIIAHENTLPARPGLPRMYGCEDLVTQFLPGENYIEDPIGRSLRVGVKRLGQTLFALTGSLTAMYESCERVAHRNRAHWGWRGDIMDKQWDGIGDGDNRWGC